MMSGVDLIQKAPGIPFAMDFGANILGNIVNNVSPIKRYLMEEAMGLDLLENSKEIFN